MNTKGIRNGNVTDQIPSGKQDQTRKQAFQESYEPRAEKTIYARRPKAARMGQVSVQEAFERMSRNGNRVYQALSKLEGPGLSDRAKEEEKALEALWKDYEQLLPQEEQTEGVEETETESKIIVKPDGSRVLVITTITNGMVTSVESLEISKPTHGSNESGREGSGEAEAESGQEGTGETADEKSSPGTTMGAIEK